MAQALKPPISQAYLRGAYGALASGAGLFGRQGFGQGRGHFFRRLSQAPRPGRFRRQDGEPRHGRSRCTNVARGPTATSTSPKRWSVSRPTWWTAPTASAWRPSMSHAVFRSASHASTVRDQNNLWRRWTELRAFHDADHCACCGTIVRAVDVADAWRGLIEHAACPPSIER